MNRLLVSLVLVMGLAAVVPDPALAQADKQRSVIYVIGDGMGPSQINIGRLAAQRLGIKYNFERFSHVGLASTRSSNSSVTDSAAGGTALACGVKTKNWTIGQDSEQRDLRTILDVAHDAGYRTGVVTTTRLTHATPAAFTVHSWHRNEEREIARQQSLLSYPEVMIGGGARYFGAAEQTNFQQGGFKFASTWAEVEAHKSGKLAALLAPSHLPYQIDEVEGAPQLKDLIRKGVELLSEGGQPFFLLVEGGRIDHACHEHDAASLVHEQLDMDEGLGWALDYQAKQDPDLLIVVSADHATGALGITEQIKTSRLIFAKTSVEALTKRVGKLTPDSLPALKREISENYVEIELEDRELRTLFKHPGSFWQNMSLGHALSRHHGVAFYDPEYAHLHLQGTHGHSGEFVPVFAHGQGAEKFTGMYENDLIVRRIAEVIGLPAPGGLVDQTKK